MTCAACFICRVQDCHGDRARVWREMGTLPACRKPEGDWVDSRGEREPEAQGGQRGKEKGGVVPLTSTHLGLRWCSTLGFMHSMNLRNRLSYDIN